MRDLFLFLVAVVLITTNVLTQSDEGKPLEACRRKNNCTYTHHVPHETDCHKFYKCLGGRGVVKDCPNTPKGPLVFNPEEQVCDWEDNVPNVICSDGPITQTTPTTTTPTSTTPTTTTSTITTPTTTTPTTTTTTTTTPTTPTTPRQPDYGCPAKGKRKLPHETDCHYYYQCVNGVKDRCRCYDTHIFNDVSRACDQAVNVPWCVTTRPVQPGDDYPGHNLCPPQSFFYYQ